jgi:CheY-like chemotaxis protein
MKVMLVDEEGAVRLRIEEALLETGGVELSLCPPDRLRGHEDVYARVLQERPDVVVLDVSMPSGGALELIGRIKAIKQSPVVIALSSSSSLRYRTLCHRAGAEYFVDLIHGQEGLTQAMVDLKKELQC